MSYNYLDILRELREDRKLSQKEIADYLGTTQQVYSRYELGKNEMPFKHVIKLAKFYNVSLDYIAGLEKE